MLHTSLHTSNLTNGVNALKQNGCQLEITSPVEARFVQLQSYNNKKTQKKHNIDCHETLAQAQGVIHKGRRKNTVKIIPPLPSALGHTHVR